MPESANLRLQIEAADADAEELAGLAYQLRNEIRNLDVESVELTSGGPAPKGTMAGGAVIPGALTIALRPPTLPSLVDLLMHWLARRLMSRHILTLEIIDGERRIRAEYDAADTDPRELIAAAVSGLSSTTPRPTPGNISLNSEGDTNVGQDVVGRDKITIQAETGATVIIQASPLRP